MSIPFGAITTNRLVSRLATPTASVNTITKQRIRHIVNKVQTKKFPKSIVVYINNLGTKSEFARLNTSITTPLNRIPETYSIRNSYRNVLTILANPKQCSDASAIIIANVNANIVSIFHITFI
jgi:hypothetical protein